MAHPVSQPQHGSAQGRQFQAPIRVKTGAELAFLPLHLVAMGLLLVSCLVAVQTGFYEAQANDGFLAFSSGAVVIALACYLRYFVGLPWFSGSIMYLGLIWLFHFGMTFLGVLMPSVLEGMQEYQVAWMTWPNARLAMILGVLASIGLTLGAGIWGRVQPQEPSTAPQESADGLWFGGWAIMLLGAGLSLAVFIVGFGFNLFAADYGTYRDLAGSTPLETFLGIAHFGCLIAICASGKRRWWLPFGVWLAIVAIPLLIVGSRAGAMVSVLAFVVVLAHRGVTVNRGVIITAAVIVATVIPAVQTVRNVGLANSSQVDLTDVTFLDTFVELGGSLESTKAYIDWIDEGDELQHGGTYLAPFDRQFLSRLLPFRERVPYELDERLPERLMNSRAGALGGSATGEAYYNFGLMGPFIFCGLVGLLLGWLERRERSAATSIFLGVAVHVLFFHVRSTWLAVPMTIIEGIILFYMCRLADRLFFAAPPVANPDPNPTLVASSR